MATVDDLQKIEMRVGRIVDVEDFPVARNPSYQLTIDVGPFVTLLEPDADCELGSRIG